MVGFEASVQRTGARWRAQLRKQEALVSRGSRESRDSRASRERAAHRRVVLNCPVLDIAHRRLVQSVSVWGGAPPVSRLSALVTLCDEN